MSCLAFRFLLVCFLSNETVEALVFISSHDTSGPPYIPSIVTACKQRAAWVLFCRQQHSVRALLAR